MTDMKTSRNGGLFLAENEGAVLCKYQDSVGVWTIGVGHTAAAGWPDPVEVTRNITPEEAVALLLVDLGPYEDDCNEAILVEVAQHEFDAAVSFHYNTGAIKTANWVDALNAGDREAAADQIMNWTSPPEVTSRRQREQDLFADGDYDLPFEIAVWDDWPGNARSVTISPEAPPMEGRDCPVCGQALPEPEPEPLPAA